MTLAGYFILAILIAVGVYEGVAVLTKRPTISQWFWSQEKGRAWFRWLVLALVLGLAYHLFQWVRL